MLDLYIDPGHGGNDPGANGFGVKEKDWTLKMSLYQYNRFKELGVKVAITRTNDKTLDSDPRTALIKNKAKYCMSNHFNAFNGSARGVEVIHSVWTNGEIAKRLANAICRVSKLPFRRVFSKQADWTKQKLDYYFIPRLTGNTISVIVEYGFIDNKSDNVYYKDEANFYKVAEAVIEEWCKILGYKYKASNEDKKEDNKDIYIVQTGDTLYKIASQHNTTTKALIELNDIVTPDLIYKGQKIKLPTQKEVKSKQKYVRVKASQLWVYDRPDWNAKHSTVKQNEVFTIKRTLKVNGHTMHQLKSGLYITNNSKYVEVYEK